MVDPRLVDYIKAELSGGTSVGQIKESLLSKGWKSEDVNLAGIMATSKSTIIPQQTYKKQDDQSSKLWMLLAVGIILVGIGVLTIIVLIVKVL